MKQVILREGKAVVEEVPAPSAGPGRVLVRTGFSVLSAGTERAAMLSGDPPAIWRSAADPSRVRRAFEILREEGPSGLLERLRERDAEGASAPGYAASGIVHGVGPGVSDLPPGTRVACAGAGYACHSEWISVPRNLVVAVPAEMALEEAAFTTLGAIALQGVRRSGIQIGEVAVVLGLGLIGNLGARILRAAGARVLGFDIDPARAARVRSLGMEAFSLASGDPLEEVPRATAGLLADAVLVYAASKGPEAVNLAMRLCRKKGKVVIVGDVGLEIDRRLMYEKELDLLISTSYGPGRYDPLYEERGIDYPAPYVRWTENRNMAAFLGLLRDGRVEVRPLIDLTFPLDDAAAAYEALGREGPDRPLGIVLRYAGGAGGPEPPAAAAGSPGGARRAGRDAAPRAACGQMIEALLGQRDDIGVGVCGAGAFVKSVHLPALRRASGFALRAVATASPLNARETARRWGAPGAAAGLQEILDDPACHLVLIGTRHNLHAAQAGAALRRGKHVFVEKPLCLEEGELGPLLEAARAARRLLAVGFNRRYSPLAVRAREVLSRRSGPSLAIYRVNAGALPPGHWARDPVEGGGRVLGECCHFADLLLFLLREPLVGVEARALPSDGVSVVSGDSFAALLEFGGGSRAVLAYTGLGDPALPKERLEIFRQGTALVLDDFRTLAVFGAPGESLDLGRHDKGIAGQWEAIGRALRGAPSAVITLDEIEATMRATFRLDRAVRGER
ncbi:MAG: bi-domain-containing oxidoreductase [Acidobacteria bacterium]|nr:bi-domain-containing oxidoreductase [Acidobacteriota bacterium]